MRRSVGSIALTFAVALCAHAQIVHTDQPSGTSELLIAVSPVSDKIVWVSGQHGTWLRTTDGGAHWQVGQVPGADSLQFRDVHAVDASTAYLLSIGNGPQSRIYKTTDAGKHWTLQTTNPDSAGFYDCMDFWDPMHGVAVGDAVGGQLVILTTIDGGGHWNRVRALGLPTALPNEGSFAASGTCLVTRPGGHAWIVSSNPQQARLLHTADFGQTWQLEILPITTHSGSGPQSVSFRDPENGAVFGGGAAVLPSDVLVAVTADGGAHWTARTTPELKQGLWAGAYVPGANPAAIVAVGPDGAVYSRDDGVTWIAIDGFDYWSVGMASPRAGWAVGAKGRITKLSGF
jgi:photosystem II stability/assembly factor-like uncharacterized protein